MCHAVAVLTQIRPTHKTKMINQDFTGIVNFGVSLQGREENITGFPSD